MDKHQEEEHQKEEHREANQKINQGTQPDNPYQQEYSEQAFWDKLKKYAKAAGATVLEPALKMYYAGTDPATPAWARTVIIGALGYFISPLDAIPDLTPVVGFSDDLGVLAMAMATVAAHITAEHSAKAREKLQQWLG